MWMIHDIRKGTENLREDQVEKREKIKTGGRLKGSINKKKTSGSKKDKNEGETSGRRNRDEF